MLDKLTIADFRDHLEETWQVELGEGSSLTLQLVRARSLAGGENQPDGREPFSVEFRGDRDPVLPQRIYPMRSQAFGLLEIFLVPIGPDTKGMLYEAVFT